MGQEGLGRMVRKGGLQAGTPEAKARSAKRPEVFGGESR